MDWKPIGELDDDRPALRIWARAELEPYRCRRGCSERFITEKARIGHERNAHRRGRKAAA